MDGLHFQHIKWGDAPGWLAHNLLKGKKKKGTFSSKGSQAGNPQWYYTGIVSWIKVKQSHIWAVTRWPLTKPQPVSHTNCCKINRFGREKGDEFLKKHCTVVQPSIILEIWAVCNKLPVNPSRVIHTFVCTHIGTNNGRVFYSRFSISPKREHGLKCDIISTVRISRAKWFTFSCFHNLCKKKLNYFFFLSTIYLCWLLDGFHI